MRSSTPLHVTFILCLATACGVAPGGDGPRGSDPNCVENCGPGSGSGGTAAVPLAETIERAIPVIEAGGSSWIEERECVTCHRVALMNWSLTAAQARGFQVSDRLSDWTGFAASHLAVNGTGNLEGVSQLLLGVGGGGDTASFRATIIGAQDGDGSWEPGGNLGLTRRPLRESVEISAMWNALALAESNPDAAATTAIAEAQGYFGSSSSAASTEWYAVRLAIDSHMNAPDPGGTAADLRAIQNADGGWAYVVGEDSDAFATGLALYALGVSGVDHSDPAVAAAFDFLAASQNADGSWTVPSTQEANGGVPNEIAGYWGTAWAVIGALSVGPPASSAE